ncbi:MAG TPA: hypothetical protein PK813_04075 [Candidatus Hydrogenedens sp.]|nr:hypothetical protein [Candidatus Hydrogenedens sp.]
MKHFLILVPRYLLLIVILIFIISFSSCKPKAELQVAPITLHFAGDSFTGIVETDKTFKVWNSGKENSVLSFKVEPQQKWITVNPTDGKVKREDPNGIDIAVHLDRKDSLAKAIPWYATGYIKVSGGGMEKVVTVTTVPNYYTEVFGGVYNRPFDLSNTTLVFIPDSGLNYYQLGIKKNITQFPQQPPDSGVQIYFTVRDPGICTSNISAIPFYGTNYTDLRVSSKGYVSFGSDGLEPTTVGKHFAFPQISLLPMNASEEGKVFYNILPSKLVITWIDVPFSKNQPTDENGNPLKANVQLELFYDGKIQITYLNIPSNLSTCVVGLSCGGGDGTNPPVQDFVISDLSSAPEI